MVARDQVSKDPVLYLGGVSYSVGGRVLLEGLGLRVGVGESVVVMGPSGSGKSTLLGVCLGTVRPGSGSVRVGGTELVGLSAGRVALVRVECVGMVFQFGELLPELSPVENVALPALLRGVSSKVAFGRAEGLLGDLGLGGVGAGTADLSGGERQRVAVARALVNEPGLVLADEPTGALDEETRDAVARLLFSVPGRWGAGLLVVTHDPQVAVLADRCLVLRGGKAVPVDPTELGAVPAAGTAGTAGGVL
jgi:lipoprotein-releasing system ATP-binding protein